MTRLRLWTLDLAAFVVVAGLGLYEAATVDFLDQSRQHLALVALGIAAAVGLCRRLPSAALALVWVVGVLQVTSGTEIMITEAAITVVAFGCARWGTSVTAVLSGVSIPAGALIAAAFVSVAPHDLLSRLDGPLYRLALRYPAPPLTIGVAVVAMLAVPWLAGLALRAWVRARRSEVGQEVAEAESARAQREAEQAREIAHLREQQARLARDVHDVVGHSLAVILAQAESGQFLPDGDPNALKQTMATIATSARSSLQDVRQVLAPGQPPVPPRDGGFEQLLDGVRASGHQVLATEIGTPQPLPPDLDVVAHRVVQEMLTNAVRHGRRDQPIHVERHWPLDTSERDLRLEVSNTTADLDETQPINSFDPLSGQGLTGMRRRVESVGGRLDVRRRTGPDGPMFTTTAWVPVRA